MVVKWVIPEELSDAAALLYRACDAANEIILAPTIMPYEVTNILRRKMVRYGLSYADASMALGELLALPIVLRGPSELHLDALELADRLHLPAAYDAHYVVLAQKVDCSLWTADRRLVSALGGRLPFVRWIGDFRPGVSL